MNYSIIACDLDGTLLGPDMDVSSENLEAIRKLTEKGIYFVPTTGRAFGEMPEALRTNPYIRYYINSNGAVIFDKKTGKSTTFGIDKRKINEIMDVLDGFRTYMTFHADGKSNVDAAKDIDEYSTYCHMNNIWTRFVRECNTPKENYSEYIRSRDEAEMFCVFFDSLNNLQNGKSLLEDLGGLRISTSAEYNIEIFSEKCGKGRTLHCLCDMLGVPYSKSMAVGDSMNDVTMLEAAGLGVCVDNALEAVKKTADLIVCGNEDHVAKYILENIID